MRKIILLLLIIVIALSMCAARPFPKPPDFPPRGWCEHAVHKGQITHGSHFFWYPLCFCCCKY